MRTELTGAEIEAYLRALGERQDQTSWSGFKVVSGAANPGRLATDLEPARSYTVIMPAKEWDTRFLRMVENARKSSRGNPLTARPFAATPAPTVSFTVAMRNYVEQLTAAKQSLKAEADRLSTATGARPTAPADWAATAGQAGR
ncbi:hypothetical protein K0B96_15670 [Horticoccus luteus]|uniref:Uncharacterized protein n=1 Tax=Horticoccus luteus TaxID=2862869 RepID=A0A8F9TTF8_9BACT|nr:hypothetical protein [Horticoccus luteus]QYM78720.1 hypothetical protein K0B96_15670 [Horticoccus luteus]